MRRTRVLHVIQNLNYGGMERLLADLVRLADRDRFESHVLALQYLGHFAEGLDRFGTLHRADPLPPWSMLWPGPLIRQLRRIAPDVVHTHSGVWYKTSFAARRAGVPRLIHTEHGRHVPDPWQARFLDRLASRRTDVVVAVSDALAQTLVEHGVCEPSQIRVVHNGVDTTVFRPRPDTSTIRGQLDIAGSTPIIGSVGRLERVKGYDVMIDAFALLRRDWPSTEQPPPVLVVGGDGAERPQLEEQIDTRGLRGSVYLLGWRDDIHDLHSAFTLFTLSSRSEGTSVSLLEAMSAGLCPVVTDVGGNAAILGEELRHRLVPPEDPAALAGAWHAALTDDARRRQDQLVARTRVCTHFALHAMVGAYEELYAGESKKTAHGPPQTAEPIDY